MKLTVILPAAGKGQRLNLPFSKEIFHIDDNKALIDFSFEHFLKCTRTQVHFIIIINENKSDILNYLTKYKNKFNITFIFQNPNENEYTGAIKSAKYLFGEYNLVLLPDTIISFFQKNIYQTVIDKLKYSDFFFFYKKESNPDILSTKGALNLQNNIVYRYQDKPKKNLYEFNAYWCSFGFKVSAFDNCIAYMEQSTLDIHNPDITLEQTSLYKTSGIEVKNYIDLGTWSSIKKEIGKI